MKTSTLECSVCRTSFVTRVFDRYGIDIPALSETRIAKGTQFEEVDGGYTFYCWGKDEGETRISVVGFAICTSIVRQLESLPKEVNDHLMQLRVMIGKHQYATNDQARRE